MSEKKITVHNCIKCDQNEVYWNVKNSAWYCSTCGFYRGEKLEMVKPIKMSNLPPELVEKMQKYILKHYPDIIPGDKLRTLSFECAQIAVEYADEKQVELLGMWSKEVDSLKHQRDELLYCLEGYKCTVNLMQETFNTSMGDSMLKEHNELLKKHEDGKE